MWTPKFLLLIAAFIASSEGEMQYLTKHDGWAFYKVRATGPMMNANVKATCEAAGMEYPCQWSGLSTATKRCPDYGSGTSGCITYDGSLGCNTHSILSEKLCGCGDGIGCISYCWPLGDTFVYSPDYGQWSDGNAWGVDFSIHGQGMQGANSFNKYALCAVREGDGLNCQNGGTPFETAAISGCSCEPGFIGGRCEIDIDECASCPCEHGTCTDLVDTFSCSCEDGWRGFTCHIDERDDCQDHECQNGDCVDAGNHYYCRCEAGFTGLYCETNIDECESSPCVHGACTDGVNSYSCSCEEGWEGYHCNQNIDDCAQNPCQHGGTCYDGHMSHSCECRFGFTGQNCEEDVNFCKQNKCYKHNACNDEDDGVFCKVPEGAVEGSYCETIGCAKGAKGEENWACEEDEDDRSGYRCYHPDSRPARSIKSKK